MGAPAAEPTGFTAWIISNATYLQFFYFVATYVAALALAAIAGFIFMVYLKVARFVDVTLGVEPPKKSETDEKKKAVAVEDFVE